MNIKKILFLCIFTLCFILFFEFFFLITPYIHETGHIIFNFLDGLYKGEMNKLVISNWENHPFISFIKIPQQTKIIDGKGSLNFTMGGPIFTILIFFGLSLFAYLRSKDKKWFLLFISILLFEMSGNIICGTDNFYNRPFSFCNHSFDLVIQYLAIFIFSTTFSYFASKKLMNILIMSVQKKKRGVYRF